MTLALVPATAGFPLTAAEVAERIDRAELLALWAEVCRAPVPDYPAAALAALPPLPDPEWPTCPSN